MSQNVAVASAHPVHHHARSRPRAGAARLLAAVAVLAAVALGATTVVALHSATLTAGRLDARRPTVARLDPALRSAVEEAARDARLDGVVVGITSGWRSRAHQRRLLDEAVSRYGSVEAARRFVATPDTSAHVTGEAVDIGPREADAWLRAHGSAYGLCQVFANEPWHYELATTPGGSCPARLPDSSRR